MSIPLLRTKLYVPPIRPGLVVRPHLLERLGEGVDTGRKLTLVSAPAGFGKSTLLSNFSTQELLSVAWVSLDESDNEVSVFWSYVIAALQCVCSPDAEVPFGQEILDLLALPKLPPTQIVLTDLLNELTDLPHKVVLVLDDYHVISAPAIHEGLTFLIEHQPPQLHLVLLTRADPPLPLSRLRARRQLTELRASDLRFTDGETTTLLNEVLHLGLSPEDIAALEMRTEGWIVGLQLAALAMQNCTDSSAFVAAFTGGHHYILEYLTAEVLHRQSPEIQTFLLKTAILDRLCASLCDVVLTTNNSHILLQHLQTANLFITPLDDERHWYRYHHLFADLLKNLLYQSLSSEEVQVLHSRASLWYEEQGDVNAAVKHALQTQDFDRVAGLVENAFAPMISQGNISALMRWLDALPDHIIYARPRLCMYGGWAMFLNGQCEKGEQLLHCAGEMLQNYPDAPETNVLRGELGAFRALIATIHQDIPEILKQVQLALSHLPEEKLASRARALSALATAYGLQGETNKLIQTCREAKTLALASGNILLASEMMSQMAFMHFHKGQLQQAARVYQEILDLVPQPQKFPPASLGYIGLALVALERDDQDAVAGYLDHGLALSLQGGIGYMLSMAYCIQAIHKQALGDGVGALAAIDKAHQLPWPPGRSEIALQLLQYRVRLHLLRGEIDTAARWLSGKVFSKPVFFDALLPVLDEIYQHARARVALAQDDVGRVLTICDSTIPQAEIAGRQARVIELTLLKALALYKQGQSDRALDTLGQCLTLAQPEGYVRLFMEAGEPLATLLQLAVKQGIWPDYADYAHMLLRAMNVPISNSQQQTGLIDSLTPREYEVLRLISDGLSNQAIAKALVVSLNTVKKHSSNIYSKLGVQSRTQAVARAQTLGLLDYSKV